MRCILAALLVSLPIGCADDVRTEPQVGPVPPLYRNATPYDSPQTKEKAVAPVPDASAGPMDLPEENAPPIDMRPPEAEGLMDPGAAYIPPDTSQSYYDDGSYPRFGDYRSTYPYLYPEVYTDYSYPYLAEPYYYRFDSWAGRSYRRDVYRPYDHHYRYDGRYLPNDRLRSRDDDVHIPGDRNRVIPSREQQNNQDPREDRTPRQPYQPSRERARLDEDRPVRDARQAVIERNRDEVRQKDRAARESSQQRQNASDEQAKREADRARADRAARERENREATRKSERTESDRPVRNARDAIEPQRSRDADRAPRERNNDSPRNESPRRDESNAVKRR